MKWTTIWVDDWSTGVGPLTPEQRGVYFTIICYFVSKDCKIPDDDHYISRMCNMTIYAYRKVRKFLVEDGFIEVIDGEIWIEKSALQWKKDEIYSKKQSIKAKKRSDLSRVKLLENNETDSAGAQPSYTPTPTLEEKDTNVSKNGDDFPPNDLLQISPEDSSPASPKITDSVTLAINKYIEAVEPYKLPVPKVITPAIKKKVGARLKEGKMEGWQMAIDEISKSPYLRGEVNGWRVSLDWFCGPQNFSKVINGTYTNQKSTTDSTGRNVDSI